MASWKPEKTLKSGSFFSFRGRGDRALYPRASTTTRALAYRLRYLERDLFLGQEHGDKEEEEKRVAKRSREPNRLESSEEPNFSLRSLFFLSLTWLFFPSSLSNPDQPIKQSAERERESFSPLSFFTLPPLPPAEREKSVLQEPLVCAHATLQWPTATTTPASPAPPPPPRPPLRARCRSRSARSATRRRRPGPPCARARTR